MIEFIFDNTGSFVILLLACSFFVALFLCRGPRRREYPRHCPNCGAPLHCWLEGGGAFYICGSAYEHVATDTIATYGQDCLKAGRNAA